VNEDEAIRVQLRDLEQERDEALIAWRNWIADRLGQPQGNKYVMDVERRLFASLAQIDNLRKQLT
jgi:SRSO17 transposase